MKANLPLSDAKSLESDLGGENQTQAVGNLPFLLSLVLLIALIALATLTGCVGYVEGPPHRVLRVQPPVVVVEPTEVYDDFVYYPQYEVYYGLRSHRCYFYDRGRWVVRSRPPGVSINVLFASPSVRLGFHDSPAYHHGDVVRQYPPSWSHSRDRDERY